MTTRTTCVCLGLLAWLAPAAAPAADGGRTTRPTLGAIRWDGWYRGNLWQRNLDPKKWHDRLPFYGRVLSDELVEVIGDSQDVMDREIGYAHAAGLDYWAFLHYHPAIFKSADQYNYGLRRYLASRRKAEMGFCLLIYPVGGDEWDKQASFVIQAAREPTYQKVAGGRPLVYLLTWGKEAMPENVWGAPDKSRAAVDRLRRAMRSAGVGDPYLVVQGMDPKRSAELVDQLGLDAISSYANWTGGNYAALVAENHRFWEACRATGKHVVPLLSAGWDPRPRFQPGGPTPTPAELGDHVRGALDWVTTHREIAPAQTIIAYAWNETDEGGWLVPTHREGTARLDAVRDALRNHGQALPRIEKTGPKR